MDSVEQLRRWEDAYRVGLQEVVNRAIGAVPLRLGGWSIKKTREECNAFHLANLLEVLPDKTIPQRMVRATMHRRFNVEHHHLNAAMANGRSYVQMANSHSEEAGE